MGTPPTDLPPYGGEETSARMFESAIHACRHHEGMKRTQAQRVGPALPGRMSCFPGHPHVAPREGFWKGRPASPCPFTSVTYACRHHDVRKKNHPQRVGLALPGRMSCFLATPTLRCGRGSGRGTLVPLALFTSVGHAWRHHDGDERTQAQRVGPGLPGRVSCFPATPTLHAPSVGVLEDRWPPLVERVHALVPVGMVHHPLVALDLRLDAGLQRQLQAHA